MAVCAVATDSATPPFIRRDLTVLEPPELFSVNAFLFMKLPCQLNLTPPRMGQDTVFEELDISYLKRFKECDMLE